MAAFKEVVNHLFGLNGYRAERAQRRAILEEKMKHYFSTILADDIETGRSIEASRQLVADLLSNTLTERKV